MRDLLLVSDSGFNNCLKQPPMVEGCFTEMIIIKHNYLFFNTTTNQYNPILQKSL